MASKRVVEVVIKVKDQASKGFDKFAAGTKKVKDGLKGISLTAAATAAAVVFAVKKMIDSIGSLIQGVADVGDSFDKMSNRTGLAVDALARWVFISELAGGSASTIESGFKKLSKAMVDAQGGLKTATRAFELLGVEFEDAGGEARDMSEVMLDLADTFEKSTNLSRDAAIAQDILGRGSAQLASTLAQGREAISAQADEYDRLHGTMEKTAEVGAEYIDAQLRLETAMTGFKERAVIPLADAFVPVLNGMAEMIADLPTLSEFMHDTGNFTALLGEKVLGLDDALSTLNITEHLAPPDMFGMAEEQADDYFDALKKIAASPELERDFSFVPDPDQVQDGIMLLEDYTSKQDALTAALTENSEIERDRLLAQYKALIKAGESADAHIAKMNDMVAAQEELKDVVDDVGANFERLAADSLSAMMKANGGAIMLGRSIRFVLIDALSAAIAKMAALAAINAFTGGFGSGIINLFGAKDGGTVKMAGGGGFTVPNGPRGRDSIPAMLTPDETVIDRTTTQRLRGFLAAQDSSMMADPSQFGGSGGGVSVSMNIARPYGVLDAMDLARTAEVAGRKLAEANL